MKMKSLILAAAAAVLPATPAFTQDVPLIPREKIFGNPVRSGAQISPDGKHLSWIAPLDGVMNVWVAPANDLGAAKAMTAEKVRPIRQYFWAPDSKSALYINDKGGDENFLLYGVDLATGKETKLTPFEKTRVQLVGSSTTIKDRILVGLNNRDPRWHDVHSLDLSTGKLTEIMRNDGYAGFVADDSLTVRMALRPNAQGGTDFFRVANGKVEEKPFASTGLEDSLTTNPAGFTTDGKTLYWIDSRGRDTAAIVAQDVATGSTRIVAEDKRADIGGVISDPKTGEIKAYSVNYLTNDWTPLDPVVGADLAFLKSKLPGQFGIGARTDADDKWIVVHDPVTSPSTTYLFDRKAKALTKLFTPRPELEGAPLVAMHPREIKARDGLTLVSYLSLPKGSDADGDEVPEKPVPMVMVVDGGPWSRDGFGYNGYHQWLANRGYAVLSVNFRGSTGFGKSFISAGDLQWGRKMHDDLIDAAQWAAKSGISPADKIAIIGGSYGGYATLAGLAFTPDAFTCGVDIVGPRTRKRC